MCVYVYICQVYIYMNTKKSYVYCIYFDNFRVCPSYALAREAGLRRRGALIGGEDFPVFTEDLQILSVRFWKSNFHEHVAAHFFSGDLHVCDEGRGGCHASFSPTPCFSFLPCRPPPLLASFLASFGLLDLWRRMLPFIENQHIIKKNKKPAKKTNQQKQTKQKQSNKTNKKQNKNNKQQ